MRTSIIAKEQHLEQHIETIARWIIECKHIVAFTGAGISTDSGIPDFRGPDGRLDAARCRATSAAVAGSAYESN